MIWLIGAGDMSAEYLKVLDAQNQECIVVGRGDSGAKKFESKTKHPVVIGGLDTFIKSNPDLPDAAIVSVGVEGLFSTTLKLLDYGVKKILVEKPGCLTFDECSLLKDSSEENNAQVFIAYNRRFYSSVITALGLIELDGGVTSFNFELTEWAHVIEKLDKKSEVLSKWFLGNSTHVADMAFFLGGKPKEISTYTSGSLKWHPSASIFSGAGVSLNGALFNYAANWESAGRWSVEVLTCENKYIFRPMESLVIQKRGSIKQEIVEIRDELDQQFKPGLYLQVKAFLGGDYDRLCSLAEQHKMLPIYEQMAAYL